MSVHYAIAVESFPHDSKGVPRYKTRYWGAGDRTWIWASEDQAGEYMDSIDCGCFHDKTAVIDDVYIARVHRDEIEGEIEEVSFTTWPVYSDEGYDTPMILEEES